MLIDCYQFGLWLMDLLSQRYMAALAQGDVAALLSLPVASLLLLAGWLAAMTWPMLPFLMLLGGPRRPRVARA